MRGIQEQSEIGGTAASDMQQNYKIPDRFLLLFAIVGKFAHLIKTA